MEKKLKKATQRIAAVGGIGLYLAATAFGAGLSNYPSNFVENGEFVGKVVVGSGNGADDATAAASIISDLEAEFSGDTEKVRITYQKSSEGGESVSATDEKQTLNFGVTNFNNIKETLDEDSTELLEDGKLDNEDYSQELVMGDDAEFNYRLFTEVDAEKASDGIYIANGDVFATYTLEFDSALSGDQLVDTTDNTMVGEVLTIMGNEFTVVELTDTEMTLIGGANKVSLGEGESTKVTVDGKSFDISVQSVGDDEVLMTVNGQSRSIDEFETEDIAGISIAVTDLVSSSRDAVKGYAEIVVGGQKIEIDSSGDVTINDEDFEDVYEEYEIEALWADNQTLTINYMIDDEVLLDAGDYLEDTLFDAFTLSYDGINSVEYSVLSIDSNSETITFEGNLYDGEAIPNEFVVSVDDSAATNLFQLGDKDERIYFSGSNNASVPLVNNLGSTMASVTAPGGDVFLELDNASLDIDDQIFFTQEDDKESMHFYRIKSTNDDGADSTISIEDLLGSTYDNREAADVQDDLESQTFAATGSNLTVDLADLSEDNGDSRFTAGDAQLYLENELIMNFQEAENVTIPLPTILFGFSDDADSDESVTLNNIINLTYQQDATDSEDPIKLSVEFSAATTSSSFEIEDDSDYKMLVDSYGTRATINTDTYDSVKIEVPDEEVVGEVSFNFGEVGSVDSVTVDSAEAEAKREELEEAGYKIVGSETLASEEVEFDVAGATLDTDAAGMDDLIVVGGPAVNSIARELLGIETYTIDQAGVAMGEGVIKYFDDRNSVLVYGYSKADTTAAVAKLNAGNLSGDEETVN